MQGRIVSTNGIILLIFFGALLVLAYSVLKSGLGYMYDADEVARVQESYLIATGHLPYKDYYTIYSPIFPILLIPIFLKEGFTFAAIDTARYFMTVLFFARVGVTSLLASMVFGKRVALLFALLFLLDPFTVFSAMQIRPDNLMMLVFAIGLVAFARGIISGSAKFMAIAGGLFALAFCIMVKAFPTLLIISGIFFLYAAKHRAFALAKSYIAGGVLVFAFYILPFLLTGSLGAMIQQSFLDPRAFQSTQDYPTPINFFYGPGNWYVYGLGGRPLNWIYAWVLPVAGFAGAYHVVQMLFKKQGKEKELVIGSALAIGMAVQWGFLFTLHTVLLQYFIPVMWLFALFAAYAIDRLLAAVSEYRLWREGAVAFLFAVYILMAKESYQANINRSKLGSGDFISLMNRIWAYVPPDAQVFPMTLFRPPSYPLAEGYFAGVHSGLLSRYPAVETYLENGKVPFVNASDYTLGYLPAQTQAYIRANYGKVESGLDLMIRKESSTLSGEKGKQ